MDPTPLSMQLFLALLEASTLVRDRVEKGLRAAGTSGARFKLLMELYRSETPLLPSDLGERLCVTRANVSPLLSGLQEEGLVESAGHGTDGRKSLVMLTPRGRRFIERVLPKHRARVDKMMSSLSPAEQADLLYRLGKLAGSLKAAMVNDLINAETGELS